MWFAGTGLRITCSMMTDTVEVNGVQMTPSEWKTFMEDCPHESFSHPGVELMDGSRMSICDRCKFIQHEAIAKIIEEGEF